MHVPCDVYKFPSILYIRRTRKHIPFEPVLRWAHPQRSKGTPMIRSIGAALALVALLLALAENADAQDMLATNGKDSVRITDKPCKDREVLGHLTTHNLPAGEFQAAHVVYNGKLWVACWRVTPGGVQLVYQDGDAGLIPFMEFKPAPSI